MISAGWEEGGNGASPPAFLKGAWAEWHRGWERGACLPPPPPVIEGRGAAISPANARPGRQGRRFRAGCTAARCAERPGQLPWREVAPRSALGLGCSGGGARWLARGTESGSMPRWVLRRGGADGGPGRRAGRAAGHQVLGRPGSSGPRRGEARAGGLGGAPLARARSLGAAVVAVGGGGAGARAQLRLTFHGRLVNHREEAQAEAFSVGARSAPARRPRSLACLPACLPCGVLLSVPPPGWPCLLAWLIQPGRLIGRGQEEALSRRSWALNHCRGGGGGGGGWVTEGRHRRGRGQAGGKACVCVCVDDGVFNP